ncbi:MAG: hydrogenase [Fibrobacterota bacterium]
MFNALLARLKQKHRTFPFPGKTPALPDRFCGLPLLKNNAPAEACRAAISACPVAALTYTDNALALDMGRCLFCGTCEKRSNGEAVEFTRGFSLAARRREDLVLRPGQDFKPMGPLDEPRLRLFERSLRLRQVSAGGCNACELDTNGLNTLVFDLPRFGIQFVASPRHADGLLITGPVTRNMTLALQKTWEAVPGPKIVIAVGACAISGGLYREHAETNNGADPLLPVDLYIPGCPPHPWTILDGLLRLIGHHSA